MKVSDLENIIIKNTSNVNMIRARKLLDNKTLTIDIYKVDKFYNIYGKFKSDNKLKNIILI